MDKKLQAVLGVAVAVALALGVVNTISLYAEDPEARLRERISIDARDDAYLYNGADLYVYSDDHSTQKYHVDGATGNLDAEGTGNFAGAVTLQSTLDVGGDVGMNGTTPGLTIGDAGAEDTSIIFDGNAQDYYIALHDSADDLLMGLGSTVGTTGIVYLDENQDTGLGGASAGSKLDVTGNVLVDGAADEVQLTAQGYTTQTNNIFVVEVSAGTDLFWVDNNGDVEMNGTTPVLTIGDAGTEDAAVVFDGNAQDFYVGLDDTEDDLVIGVGSALGTTQAIGIDESANTDVAGTLQYGANDLYPVGYASSGQQMVYGTASITGTATAAHGLTTVTFCMATLGEDPTNGAGDAAHVTVAVSANVCTLKAWQDDFVTAATETDVAVHWVVVGAP